MTETNVLGIKKETSAEKLARRIKKSLGAAPSLADRMQEKGIKPSKNVEYYSGPPPKSSTYEDIIKLYNVLNESKLVSVLSKEKPIQDVNALWEVMIQNRFPVEKYAEDPEVIEHLRTIVAKAAFNGNGFSTDVHKDETDLDAFADKFLSKMGFVIPKPYKHGYSKMTRDVIDGIERMRKEGNYEIGPIDKFD